MILIEEGIQFNNKHSYRDFGLILKERDIGNPSKVKVKERVPYSNLEYDFSNLYGSPTYEERPLSYTFHLVEKSNSKINYMSAQTAVLNWLCGTLGKTPLKDDVFPDYYFLAEVEDGPSTVYFRTDGTITVKFMAYPFKIAELQEGNDIWDSFNFLLDYAQDTSFEITSSADITLYNPGISVVYPIITATESMQIEKDDITYNIPIGSTKSYEFSLSPGENEMKIIGTGSISFEYYKELI